MAAVDAGDGENPLVSVIIPCFNYGHLLGEAIESALAQTYAPIEVIVVDDGSTDSTPEVARSYERVRLIQQSNQGQSRARNAGLRAARGREVLFLDADDVLLRDAVERLAGALRSRPEAGYVTGLCQMMDRSGTPGLPVQGSLRAGPDELCELFENGTWTPGAVLLRRDVVEEAGGFDKSAAPCEDLDLYTRIARRLAVYELGVVVALYRDGGAMSRDRLRMVRAMNRLIRRHGREAASSSRDRSQWTKGLESLRDYYTGLAIEQADEVWVSGDVPRVIGRLLRLVLDCPKGFLRIVRGIESNRVPFFVGAPEASDGSPFVSGEGLSILSLDPDRTRPAVPFNVQADGSSAITVRCRGATRSTAVVMGRRRLRTTFDSDELLTATVPPELFAVAGVQEVYLRRLDER